MTRLEAALIARDAAALAHHQASAPLNPPDEATGLELQRAQDRCRELFREINQAQMALIDAEESLAITERYWASMPAETAALFAADDIDARRAKLAAARTRLEEAKR